MVPTYMVIIRHQSKVSTHEPGLLYYVAYNCLECVAFERL